VPNTSPPTASQPLVSVVLPTYNRPDYLREALESALHQTYDHLEILVADDASADATREVVSQFSDKRLQYRRNAANLGQGRNIIGTCRAARGTYVAMLHDDDHWEPEFLATLVPQLERNPGAVLAFCDLTIIDAAGRVDPQSTEAVSRQSGRHMLQRGIHRPFCALGLVRNSLTLAMASVIRRSALDWADFPPEVDTTYDLWLAYLLCATGKGAYYEPRRLVQYRMHPQSLTNRTRARTDRGLMYCYTRFLADPTLSQFRKDFRRLYGRAQVDLGLQLLWAGQPTAARLHLWSTLQRRPTPKLAAALALSLVPSPVLRPVLTRWKAPRVGESFAAVHDD
jgi:glycosyltransferase involved in cell wall biosynthesis